MRLDPVVGSLHRVAAKDFELAGYHVPKGKLLMLPLQYLAAHDPRFEGDSPGTFRPERMLTAEAQKKGDQMPFGYGPRCGVDTPVWGGGRGWWLHRIGGMTPCVQRRACQGQHTVWWSC